MNLTDVQKLAESIRHADRPEVQGRVTRVVGMAVEATLPGARIGSICRLEPQGGSDAIDAEVVGFRDDRALLMPLGRLHGLTPGTRVHLSDGATDVSVGPGCLGRVLDGLGRPIDGAGPLTNVVRQSPPSKPISPFERRGIERPLDLGVRSVNSLLTACEGQRLAVMAGAGVGKSTLLGMIARNTQADVAVVALIGERGGEVQKFVREDLFSLGMATDKIVVVAATSDEPPAMRIRAAFTATAIAECFRASGKRVLLLMDSLTRVVMAQREVGLSIGEPPATRGYPPSAFALIPRLLERAGVTAEGSVTGIYTTLVEGDDDLGDPVTDAVRGTTDGHILLSRRLSERGQYPPIDVTRSVSRSMNDVVSPEHQRLAQQFRAVLQDLESARELRSVGAYRPGSDPDFDRAMKHADALEGYLRQRRDEVAGFDASLQGLRALMAPMMKEDAHAVC